jgi:hypothetical protein
LTRARFAEGSLGESSIFSSEGSEFNFFFRGVVVVSAVGIDAVQRSGNATRSHFFLGTVKRSNGRVSRRLIIHAAVKRAGVHVNDTFNRFRISGIENCDVISVKVFAQVIFVCELDWHLSKRVNGIQVVLRVAKKRLEVSIPFRKVRFLKKELEISHR